MILEQKNWTDARKICNDIEAGYDLATIRDSVINDFIKHEVTETNRKHPKIKFFWMGLKEHPTKGQYVWHDGSGLTFGIGLKNPPWLDSEPNEVIDFYLVICQAKDKLPGV